MTLYAKPMRIPVPPINLLNINSAMTLLLSYPLLVSTAVEEQLDAATHMYYNQGHSGHISATSNAQREV